VGGVGDLRAGERVSEVIADPAGPEGVRTILH
jgi:hypothetical protein